MAIISYPSGLPAPWTAPIKSNDRRLISDLQGLRKTRGLNRDRLATQELQFVFYSEDDVEVFHNWVKDDLVNGGAWFTSDWPLPQGGTGVRKFMRAPQYPRLQGVGVWTVSAMCEVRGRGELPGTTDLCALALASPLGMTLRLRMLYDGDFTDTSGNYPPFSSISTGTVVTDPVVLCGTGSLHLPNSTSYAAPSVVGGGNGIPLPGNFKIICIVYPEALDTGTGLSCIFSERNESDPFTTNLFVFGIGEGGLFARLNNIEYRVSGGAGAFEIGRANVVSVERIDGILKFRKDGMQIGSNYSTSFVNDADSYLSIGYEPLSYLKSFVGYVDNLSVWTE